MVLLAFSNLDSVDSSALDFFLGIMRFTHGSELDAFQHCTEYPGSSTPLTAFEPSCISTV